MVFVVLAFGVRAPVVQSTAKSPEMSPSVVMTMLFSVMFCPSAAFTAKRMMPVRWCIVMPPSAVAAYPYIGALAAAKVPSV